MLWFEKIDVEKVLEGFSLWCKYGGIAEYDLETDGRNYTITLHHEIGEKWSNLIGHLISQGIKTELGLPNASLSGQYHDAEKNEDYSCGSISRHMNKQGHPCCFFLSGLLRKKTLDCVA